MNDFDDPFKLSKYCHEIFLKMSDFERGADGRSLKQTTQKKLEWLTEEQALLDQAFLDDEPSSEFNYQKWRCVEFTKQEIEEAFETVGMDIQQYRTVLHLKLSTFGGRSLEEFFIVEYERRQIGISGIRD